MTKIQTHTTAASYIPNRNNYLKEFQGLSVREIIAEIQNKPALIVKYVQGLFKNNDFAAIKDAFSNCLSDSLICNEILSQLIFLKNTDLIKSMSADILELAKKTYIYQETRLLAAKALMLVNDVEGIISIFDNKVIHVSEKINILNNLPPKTDQSKRIFVIVLKDIRATGSKFDSKLHTNVIYKLVQGSEKQVLLQSKEELKKAVILDREPERCLAAIKALIFLEDVESLSKVQSNFLVFLALNQTKEVIDAVFDAYALIGNDHEMLFVLYSDKFSVQIKEQVVDKLIEIKKWERLANAINDISDELIKIKIIKAIFDNDQTAKFYNIPDVLKTNIIYGENYELRLVSFLALVSISNVKGLLDVFSVLDIDQQIIVFETINKLGKRSEIYMLRQELMALIQNRSLRPVQRNSCFTIFKTIANENIISRLLKDLVTMDLPDPLIKELEEMLPKKEDKEAMSEKINVPKVDQQIIVMQSEITKNPIEQEFIKLVEKENFSKAYNLIWPARNTFDKESLRRMIITFDAGWKAYIKRKQADATVNIQALKNRYQKQIKIFNEYLN